MNFAIKKFNSTVIPASPLDHVLLYNNPDIKVTFIDFLEGEILTDENKRSFYQKIVDNVDDEVYPTTDHLITCIECDGIYFLYVSLDNSVRSNINLCPLYTRLSAICKLVSKIMESLNNRCIVFFSESCRPSFLGGMNQKENLVSWLKMRRIISTECNLEFITEERNNNDQSSMSFGISVFCHPNCVDLIDTYFVKNILNEGFGSAAVGIKTATGKIIWGIHFPLDFKNSGADNLGHKTMVNLQELMKSYDGSICAFGDFNTIPGKIYESIKQAITPDFRFDDENTITFFGSYYDTIPLVEEWDMLLS